MQTQPTKADIRTARNLIRDDAENLEGAPSNVTGTLDWLLIDPDRRNALRVLLDVFAR